MDVDIWCTSAAVPGMLEFFLQFFLRLSYYSICILNCCTDECSTVVLLIVFNGFGIDCDMVTYTVGITIVLRVKMSGISVVTVIVNAVILWQWEKMAKIRRL